MYHANFYMVTGRSVYWSIWWAVALSVWDWWLTFENGTLSFRCLVVQQICCKPYACHFLLRLLLNLIALSPIQIFILMITALYLLNNPRPPEGCILIECLPELCWYTRVSSQSWKFRRCLHWWNRGCADAREGWGLFLSSTNPGRVLRSLLIPTMISLREARRM